MADDAALRARRSRAHRAGNHMLCDPRRCGDARREASGESGPESGESGPESVAAELAGFVATLNLAEGDPKAVIASCAARLAARIDQGGGALAPLVRELHSCVDQLAAEPGRPGGTVDLFRARRHLRRLEFLLPGA